MKKLATLLALSLSMAAVTLPSRADESLQSILSGNKIPLTIKLQDLDGNWRQLVLSGISEFGDLTRAYSSLFGISNTSGLYYTKGETIEIYNKTYIIAYRVRADFQNLTFQKLIENTVGTYGSTTPGCSEESLNQKLLAPDTTLALALLDVQTIGSMNDIRIFDFAQEQANAQQVYDAAKLACNKAQIDATNSQVSSHLYYLNQALLSYASANQGNLPSITNAAALADILKPYLYDPTYLNHPVTQEAYQPNTSLSGKKLADIANQYEIVSFYESTPAADGTIGVVYLDGATARVKSEDWAKVKQTSGIR